MRINPITVQTNMLTRKNQQKTNQQRIIANSQIRFKGSAYEEEVEREVLNKRDNYTWWKWNFGGGEEKERKNAKAKIDKRNHDNEIARIKAETLNEANMARMKDLGEYTSNLEKQQRKNDELMQKYEQSRLESIQFQKDAMDAHIQAAETLKSQLQDYQKILKEQQDLQAKRDQETQELMKKMEEAREKNDKKMEERFEKELERMRKMYEEQMKSKAEQAAKTRNIEEIFRRMNEFNENKGFGRLAGYEKEKGILMQMVGSPIALEKDGQKADVPNGILFYGPKGNGKTIFAESFAEQLDCNRVKMENTLDDAENLKKLREVAAKAQENFEQTKKRTIIHIDEFDEYAPKGSRIVGPLKSFMDDCSKEYHCTVFATTNFPENIDDILIRDGRFTVKVPLSPADEMNALDILKFYGDKFADNTVNYEKIVQEIIKPQPLMAFSNEKIKNIVTTYVKQFGKEKMSHNDFMASLKSLCPDIDKEAMARFKKQIEYVKHA